MANQKRQRTDTATVGKPASKDHKKDKKPEKGSKAVAESAKPASTTIEDFPRGGSTGLTPLEYKDISRQVNQDILFSDTTSGLEEPPSKKVKASKKSKKTKSSNTNDKEAEDEKPKKIDILNFKRLATGSLMMGVVTQINELDVTVSLPNHLIGFVSITEISDAISTLVEIAAKAEEDSDDEEMVDTQLPSLKEIFQVGQYVNCSVTKLEGVSDKGAKAKRRIELSLNPSTVNAGIARDDLCEGMVLSAAVQSVEDHGYLLSTGVDGVTGFLHKKDTAEKSLAVGQVVLGSIKSVSENNRTINMTIDSHIVAKALPSHTLSNMSSLIPSTLINGMVAAINPNGITCKFMGFYDGTIDFNHLGLVVEGEDDISKAFKVGQKIRARILYMSLGVNEKIIGLSLAPHVLSLSQPQISGYDLKDDAKMIPMGTIFDKVTVKRVDSGVGILCEIDGVKGVVGQTHISRLSDSHVASLSGHSGKYKIGSKHPARVVGYDSLDGILQLSMQKSVLDEKYLNVDDIQVGEVIKGKIHKLINNGILIEFSSTINGFVPTIHMSDIKLLHPEKKFKAGDKVKCRVLHTDASQRKVILTLKKSLVNSQLPIVKSYSDAAPGVSTHGVITSVKPTGCIVTFFNNVKALAPLPELSDSFIKDPTTHFNVGQVVKCRVLTVDPEREQLRVSFKSEASSAIAREERNTDMSAVALGEIVSGKVTSLLQDVVHLILEPTNIRATLPVAHLSDHLGSILKSITGSIKVGDTISDMVVYAKNEQKSVAMVSRKPLLVKAAKKNQWPKSASEVSVGSIIPGYVRNVTDFAVFVGFVGDFGGIAFKNNISDQFVAAPADHFSPQQTVLCNVTSVNVEEGRVELSLKPSQTSIDNATYAKTKGVFARLAKDPFDKTIETFDDYQPGRITKGQVASIKELQVNINLAANIKGRVHISEIYDQFDDIKDKTHIFKNLKPGSIIDVKVIGYHDAKTHKYLPITHRTSAAKTVVELTIKPSEMKAQDKLEVGRPQLEELKAGTELTGFVQKALDDGLWIYVSPNLRGRVLPIYTSNDIEVVQNIPKHFTAGMAVRCNVLDINTEKYVLDLSLLLEKSPVDTFEDVKTGTSLIGRVASVKPTGLNVQLSKNVFGRVGMTDIFDAYVPEPLKQFKKDQYVKCHVLAVDAQNHQIDLSLRTSYFDQSIEAVDPQIQGIEQVEVNSVIRGYIKNINDNGCFVSLSRNIAGRVKISEISDAFVKEWKTEVKVGQLVTARVLAVDPTAKRVELSLKKSQIDPNVAPLLTLADIQEGEKIKGFVKRIESYGIFIRIDDSNISGLCHISEVSDTKVEDLNKLYSVGDRVKAVILKIDTENKKVSFGLKATYFNDDDMESDSSEDEELEDSMDVEDDSDDENEAGESLLDLEAEASDDEDDGDEDEMDSEEGDASEDDEDEDDDEPSDEEVDAMEVDTVLPTAGFKWDETEESKEEMNLSDSDNSDASDDETQRKKKKKNQKAEAVDVTAELGHSAPTVAADYERLLLGSPNSSYLWINYMAFQLQLSEIQKAREIGERAIKAINFPMMNLENKFGTQETLEAVFQRAAQVCEPKKIYLQLVQIYERSDKLDLAEQLYKTITKKFGASSKVWTNFGLFYLKQGKVDLARELLQRSLKSLAKRKHIKTITKFAQLEFKYGEPERGRTIFEGIMSNYPKRVDLWSIYLDMETRVGDQSIIRRLFQRVTSLKLSSKKMKFFFKKWLAYEKKFGDEKSETEVKQRALAYIESISS
ncbi:nucleic acid-binding protein [Basidiobolus meristosporus CBS 931.73]|uniref:Protein RRP5 homolog n=1 Tax=Basidiobolus meristosporus CBS 931.73 TaxID=1314790 RepID=A0A1Y1Y603_9FUNG|nr:nucleic acid-binding protein [Basidiobolus meristosporus CBS 931.73]|eukprot:ORX93442.1 nucleic acid-binding protein [Basidiobolus meristosporus CBS 931.73]